MTARTIGCHRDFVLIEDLIRPSTDHHPRQPLLIPNSPSSFSSHFRPNLKLHAGSTQGAPVRRMHSSITSYHTDRLQCKADLACLCLHNSRRTHNIRRQRTEVSSPADDGALRNDFRGFCRCRLLNRTSGLPTPCISLNRLSLEPVQAA